MSFSGAGTAKLAEPYLKKSSLIKAMFLLPPEMLASISASMVLSGRCIIGVSFKVQKAQPIPQPRLVSTTPMLDGPSMCGISPGSGFLPSSSFAALW